MSNVFIEYHRKNINQKRENIFFDKKELLFKPDYVNLYNNN